MNTQSLFRASLAGPRRGIPLATLIIVLLCSVSVEAQTWELTSLSGAIDVECLIQNPTTGTLYAGTYSGAYRSSDYGATWTSINTGLTDLTVMSLGVDSAGNIFAGTWSSPGLFISNDSGNTWSPANNGLSSTFVGSIQVTASGDIWVAGRDGLHISMNNGASWTGKITGFELGELAINSSGHLFAGTGWDTTGIFRSVDGGDNWDRINDPPIDVPVWDLHFDIAGNVWAATDGLGVFRSVDNGDNWTQIGEAGWNRIHSITSNSQAWILVGTYFGGVYLTDTSGVLWTQENTGLTDTDVGAILITSANEAFVGTFGSGVFRTVQCPDADQDWVCDAEDNCPNDPNLMQEDVDGDGYGDVCDNCPNDFNPGQEDTDFDGKGDACDPPTEDVIYNTVPGDNADLFYSVVADLDRDNYPDLVFSEPDPGGVFIAYGGPGGALAEPVSLLAVGSAALAIDYVDTDSLPDVAIVTTTTIDIALNLGGRSFSIAPQMTDGGRSDKSGARSSSAASEVLPAVATGYFDNDQILDMVVAPNMILTGLGNGDFSSPTFVSWQMDAVNVCDFNRDGFDDLIVLDGSQIIVYLNYGVAVPTFGPASYTQISTPNLQLPPSHQVADFDWDGYGDFAIVTPLADPADQSMINILFWESTGEVLRTLAIPVLGTAQDLVVSDPNRDGNLDIVVANGSEGQLETYFGDSEGHFSDPDIDPIAATTELTYVLSTLDLDRDGNPDFLSGATGGGDMLLAYNQNDPQPIIQDENYFPMITTGYSNTMVRVVNPAGFVISRYGSTVAGSDYWRVDINSDGLIDEQAVDFNVQSGLYTIRATVDPRLPAPDRIITVKIGIDGSQPRVILTDYNVAGPTKAAGDEIEFPLMIYSPGQEPDALPLSGHPVSNTQPMLSWHGLAGGTDPRYGLQLNTRHDFTGDLIVEATDLTLTEYPLGSPLPGDSVYYWWVVIDRDNDGEYEETSIPYALYITGCCAGRVGDANGLGGDEPTIGDVSTMIDALFISGNPGVITCLAEADINQSGGAGPQSGDITIGDVSTLIDYLFITGPSLGLPECL